MNLGELQENWDEFARTDPLYAILTAQDKKGGKWQLPEFFETGKTEVAALFADLSSLSLSVGRGQALDFGCGVGRLTQALAEYFERVIGVDIAPSMIEQARLYNKYDERCAYVLNESDDLACFADDSFDFIYSNYTLQHMHPRYAERYLAEFARILAPMGILVFQLPSAHVPERTLKQRIKRMLPSPILRQLRGKQPMMETHAIPQDRIVQLLGTLGATLVSARRDPHHDGRWISLTYYVSKGAYPYGATEKAGVAETYL